MALDACRSLQVGKDKKKLQMKMERKKCRKVDASGKCIEEKHSKLHGDRGSSLSIKK